MKAILVALKRILASETQRLVISVIIRGAEKFFGVKRMLAFRSRILKNRVLQWCGRINSTDETKWPTKICGRQPVGRRRRGELNKATRDIGLEG